MEEAGRPWGAVSWRARLGAVGFAVAGAGLLAWLIHRADAARLWQVVERGAAWLPLLVAIEGVRLAVEAWGGRKLYVKPIAYPGLLRATWVAYAVAALAPGGRATGEAVKAVMLRNRTGLADTAAAATSIQTSSLLGLGVWSLVCTVVALGVSLPLAGALALQTVVVCAGALAVRGIARTSALGRLLGHVSSKAAAALDAVRRRARVQRIREPVFAFVVSRGLELVQYGLVFFAITHRFVAVPVVLTFGVATVAGSVGDSVPVQLGVLGAGFSTAASAIGISREDALAFELLAHGFQIAWTVVGLLTPLLWRLPRGGESHPRHLRSCR